MRVRLLHPEFFTDARIARCSDFARLVFAGLWLMADRDGRLVDSVKMIDGLILPHDDRSCAPALDELANLGRIQRYTAEAHRVIQVVNFTKYQHIHPKERPSKLPGQAGKNNGLDPVTSTSTSTSTSDRATPDAPTARSGRSGVAN